MVEIANRNVDFKEAIDFFKEKVQLPTRSWTDLWQGMHARAFVVAGATKDELIADFHGAISKALEQGTTLDEFRRDFDTIVARHGWSYKGSRGWRSRVIFETNVGQAYQAGRWQQAQRLKARRPYLRYVAVRDQNSRPEHAAWHGTVLHIDDPWWRTHHPRNAWGCRCSTQQLSDRDLKRFGFAVSEEAPPIDWEDREINTPTGRATVQVPKGIDPGFAYNPGEAASGRGPESMALEAHGGFDRMLAPAGKQSSEPEPLPVETTRTGLGPRGRTAAGLRRALTQALGGEETILTDPAGGRVKIGPGLVEHQLARNDGREVYWPLIRELVEDPQEIWVGFVRHPESGRYSVRRRYVKMLALAGDRPIALVADADKGNWSALTYFPERDRDLSRNIRWGFRIFRKGE